MGREQERVKKRLEKNPIVECNRAGWGSSEKE